MCASEGAIAGFCWLGELELELKPAVELGKPELKPSGISPLPALAVPLAYDDDDYEDDDALCCS